MTMYVRKYGILRNRPKRKTGFLPFGSKQYVYKTNYNKRSFKRRSQFA